MMAEPVTRPRDLPARPLASGAPYWYFLGGRPALDFVNTRRERWNRDVDCLVDERDLGLWLVRANLLSAGDRTPRGLLARARALREAIDAGVRAVVAGEAPGADALGEVDAWLAYAVPRPQLRAGPDGLPRLGERVPRDPARRALGAIALDAAAMLGRPEERARVRICGSETCSARFYDRSPAARRRWCSMDFCGNVAKARRHRARRAAG